MSPRRNATERALLTQRLGRDLRLDWAGTAGSFAEGDLARRSRRDAARGLLDIPVDVATVEDVDQAVQMLVTRLMTRKGELAVLGHPEYGSRHHALIGEPNTERTRNLVKVHILECLRHEPRVAKILRCVVDPGPRARDVVRVLIDVRLIDRDEPLNLVVPVPLGVS